MIDGLFASLCGGAWFSKSVLKDAYQQIPLDAEVKKLAVINTHRGLYGYKRLPYGIASAPAIFQRRMEAVLRDVPGTHVFLDDVSERESKFESNLH